MKQKLHSIKAYLDDEEYRQFKVRVQARGVTESAYIREQLSFEVKQRGAPKGTVQKKKVGRPRTRGKRPQVRISSAATKPRLSSFKGRSLS